MDYLLSLGLLPNEIKLYLELLQVKRPVTVMELSQFVAIPRSTVHQNIKSLIQKGFVSEMRLEVRRRVKAERPFVVEAFLLQKKLRVKNQYLRLKSLHEELPQMLGELEKIGRVDT
jgi:predicted transcriptional regulator